MNFIKDQDSETGSSDLETDSSSGDERKVLTKLKGEPLDKGNPNFQNTILVNFRK